MAKVCRVKEVHQVFSFIDMEYFKDNQKCQLFARICTDIEDVFNVMS